MIQFGVKLIVLCLPFVLTVQHENVLTITVCSDIKSGAFDKCINLRQALQLLTSCYSSSCSILRDQSSTICSLTCCNSTCYHHVNIIFEPGDHVLSETYKITDLNSVRFSSIDNEPATIKCNINDKSDSGIAFIKVNNLTIEYLNIIGCGMKHVSTSQFKVGGFVMFQSALFIQNSTDVTIKHTNISDSDGIGLSIIDTNGTVNIVDSVFSNNQLTSSEKNINVTGGGGLYVEFTKCSPGIANCSTTDNLYNKNSSYNIVNCNFTRNNATYSLQSSGSYNFAADTYDTFGDGGGLAVWLFGKAYNNSIQIISTKFISNVAKNGGGLCVHSRQNASHNRIYISGCIIKGNRAVVFGAGGALLGFNIYHPNERNMYNNFLVANSLFEENEAVGGTAGGLGWYGSNEPDVPRPTNHVRVYNTSFVRNCARFGFAMEIHKGFLHFLVNGRMLDFIIDSCSFIENGLKSLPQSTLAVQNNSLGAVVASEVGIQIRGYTSFVMNRFTALVLDKEKVEFCENSVTVFQNNNGVHGGAILLIDTAWIMVNYSSTVTFVGNTATVAGSAIYVQLITPYDHTLSHSCFIRYFEQNTAVSKWNATFTFISNTSDFACGQNMRPIYATTLHPCKSLYSNKFLNEEPFCFCSPGKRESNNLGTDRCLECTHNVTHVATSPVEFRSFSGGGNVHVIPGEVHNLSIYLVDEVGNMVTDARYTATCINKQSELFSIHKDNCSSSLSLPYVLSPYGLSDGLIQIAGKPSMTCHLQLQTITDFPITTTLEVVLEPCPPGFMFSDYNAQCECIVSRTDQNLAISGCELKSFRAYFDQFYWIGYESNSTEQLVISACPYRYCYQEYSSDQLLPGVADRQVLDRFVCGNTSRTGLLCGQCIDGYSVALNSPTFACQKCKGSYYLGILYLFLSYIIPVTILFYVIMAYDIRMTTGPIGAFLFFSQIVGSQYHYTLVYSINANTATTVAISNILLAFYSISNLNFFNHSIFSYCLFKRAGTIDIIAFELLLSFYPVILIVVYFLVRKYCFCHSRFRYFNRWRFSSNAISHGVSAFLIFCFAKITLLAFALLIPAELRHSDGTGFEIVVYLQGNLKYFREFSYNMYVLVSVFTIVIVITIPTLILLFHPIMMQVADYFEKGESRVVLLINKCLLINKLKPILDSFQGDYKDSFRCFAGLQIFLYRILFFLIAVVATPNVSLSLLLLIGFFVVITLVHILALPFKRHLDNAVYSMIYLLMLAIFVIEMYTESADTFLHVIVWLQLILLALPLCCFIVYYIWKLSLTVLRWFRPQADMGEKKNEVPV